MCWRQLADFKTLLVKGQKHERHQTNILNWQDKSKQFVQPPTSPPSNSHLFPFTGHCVAMHNKTQSVLRDQVSWAIEYQFAVLLFSKFSSQEHPLGKLRGEAYAGLICSNFSLRIWPRIYQRKCSSPSFFTEDKFSCPTLCSDYCLSHSDNSLELSENYLGFLLAFTQMYIASGCLWSLAVN